MRSRQRLYAAIERSNEIGKRTPRVLRLGDDCADGCQHVFYAMVELRNKRALLFLHPFPFGHVNADADDSVRASFTVIGNETAGLNPAHLATSTNDAVLYAIFAPARTERLAAELFHPPYVVWMHASQAFAASYLDSVLGKAVNGRIAFRNLHDLRVGVVRVTADESRLSCQRELHGALAQSQLGFLALGNISRQAFDAQELVRAVELASRSLLQPDLASVPTAKAEIQGIGRVARTQFAYLRLEGLAIIGVDLPEEFVAQRVGRSKLVVSENASGIVAAPRLACDGIPFKCHYLAGHQSISQTGLVLLERSFRHLALRDVDVRTDEAWR